MDGVHMILSTSLIRAFIVSMLLAIAVTAPRAQTGCAGVVDPAFVPPTFHLPSFFHTPLLAPADNGVVASIGSAVVRLDQTGGVDTRFVIGVRRGVHDGLIKGIERDTSGRYVIWGYFDAVDSIPRAGIARLLPTGQLDPTFVTPVRQWDIDSAGLAADGKYIVAIQTNVVFGHDLGPKPAILIRLHEDGSIDPQFNAGSATDNVVAA